MYGEVSDFIDVEGKVGVLGCAMPTGVTVLPYNFEAAHSLEDLCYVGMHLDLRERLRSNGIPGTSLEQCEETAVRVLLRESALPPWIPPVLFVTGTLVLQNPTVVDVLLGVVSNFIYDLSKRAFGREPTDSDQFTFSVVKWSVRGLTYKKATFRGSWKKGQLEGLKEFGKIVRNM